MSLFHIFNRLLVTRSLTLQRLNFHRFLLSRLEAHDMEIFAFFVEF